MKNAKRNSREKKTREVQEVRAAALRGLSKTVLKDVRGGDGGTAPIYPSDPIC